MEKNDNLEKWETESKKLADEMILYAKEYKCKKCTQPFCEHMVKSRTQKFGKNVEQQMKELVVLNSVIVCG